MPVDLKEFDDLINLGRLTKTLDVGGRSIVIRTLNSQQYSKAVSNIQDDLPSSKRYEAVQREIVAAALESIDGQELDYQTKINLLSVGQLGFSNLLYSAYLDLIGEQEGIIKDAKKNSSQDQKA